MSTAPAALTPQRRTPDVSTDMSLSSSQTLKPKRVLACVFCQQRKIKCDRRDPCSNCIKSRVECVPSSLNPRRRRRKFPEQQLLERLRKYEDLLHQNNIAFEPVAKDPAKEKPSPNAESVSDSDDDHTETIAIRSFTLSPKVKSERGHEAKNLWHAMSQGFRDPNNDSDSSHDDMRETVVRKAWDQLAENDDHLLFGSHRTAADLSTVHPEPVQIFKLWQIYLDNVNPLLKVTHTLSLQARIIEAAGNLPNVNPTLGALMFSIYCMAVRSLLAEECKTMFGSSKEDLLMRYRFGCQQALLSCGFLRSSDRDCLTALYLYLSSVAPISNPQSLSSLLGIAIRTAERIGIHSEWALAKCTAVEAEMGRRLWWALVLFDTRVCETANLKTVTLNPTWDCKTPLNVNDSDLRPEMKGPPAIQTSPSDAFFAVVRSELADYTRHTMYHLDFTTPALKPIAKSIHSGPTPEGGELVKLEEMIEDRYLRSCDQENPIHFMTMWTTRAYLAKARLMEHHWRYSSISGRQTEEQRNIATSHALGMLKCDTKIMTSPLTKGFRWLNLFRFPFPAYVQILQDLRRRPMSEQARHAWAVMSDDYDAWFDTYFTGNSPFFPIFAKFVLQAWEAREAASEHSKETLAPPRIVVSIRQTQARMTLHAQNAGTENLNSAMDIGIDEFAFPTGFGDQNLPYSTQMQDVYEGMGSEIYTGIPEQASLNAHMNQLNWAALDGRPGWGGY